jgi:acetoin utilization deacetylase AcuC-like enzyme
LIKIAYHPIYKQPLPEGHRFPMIKYELIPEQLMYEGTFEQENFFVPNICEEADIRRVHTEDYIKSVCELTLNPKAQRKIGFPLNEALVKRERMIAQGTYDCSLFALKYVVAFNVAGGTHHAYADAGEGFCIFNDVAIAAAKLLFEKIVKKVLVLDLDVHQGNGTAKIFEQTPEVFTFSMHGKDNYPLHKETSNLDIELETHCDDHTYLEILKENLRKLLIDQKPDIVYFVSGVDILKTDKLGKLAVSQQGCKERDRFVFETLKKEGIPVVVVMGGGYSPRIADIVDAHCNTFRMAASVYS